MKHKSSSDPAVYTPHKIDPNMNPRSRHLMTISGETFFRQSSIQLTESSPPCCVAGEHILTSTNKDFLHRSLSINSIVNVDITDISGDEEMIATTFSLRRCKETVLRPYTWILLLIGWRPYGKERISNYPQLWKIINFLYPLLVITLLWYSNVMQAVTCHGKLNPKTDTIPVTILPPGTTINPNITTTAFSVFDIFGKTHKPIIINETSDINISIIECNHIITTYVIPSVLHFLAFLYGFHYFRIQENEQLYSLMERVFVQAQTTIGVQDVLIRNSRLFLLASAIWLLLNIGLEILYVFAFETRISSFTLYLSVEDPSVKYLLIFMRFIGIIMTQGINIAVVVNYSTQCEMLIMHIRGICLHLHEKTVDIKSAMHEILGMKEFISLLNGTLGKMTGLCVISFVELVAIGISLFLFNQVNKSIVWSYRILFLIVWIMATLFPLVQAARVSKTGRKLRQISLEMRVFGYQASSQMELDSFILFINTAALRAKLFGIPIKPGVIVLTIIIILFCVLLLIITDKVAVTKYLSFL